MNKKESSTTSHKQDAVGHVMDDDFFDDDDGLDDLPENTLQDLEDAARRFTQHTQSIARAENTTSSDYGLGDNEETVDLDANTHANVATLRKSNQHLPIDKLPQRRDSQPLKEPDEVSEREQWRAQRYGAASQQRLPAFKAPRPNPSTVRQLQAPAAQKLQANGYNRGPQVVESDDHSEDSKSNALEAKIVALEQRNAILTEENQNVKADSYAKAGEISIVRANAEKTSKEYEQKLSLLQQRIQQEATKHRAEMEAAKKDREKMETNNKFLEHDLAQETTRIKNAKRAGQDLQANNQRGKTVASPASTPKKGANLPFRDGFNDSEVISISPSISKEKSKPGTPRAANKRKRSELEKSPANQLSFSESDIPVTTSRPNTPPAIIGAELPIRAKEIKSDERFNLVQLVLEHRSENGRRTIECLHDFSCPSNSTISLSSYVYDALQSHIFPESSKYESEFVSRILDTWSRCIQESLFEPVALIISLLRSVLAEFDEHSSAPVATKLIRVVVQTTDLVALPRARKWNNPTMNEGLSMEIERFINSLQCLELFYLITVNCYNAPEMLKDFWSQVEHDFVLVMLHRGQPIEENVMMLRILASSVLIDSFGTISRANDREQATQQRQNQNEHYLILRLGSLLVGPREQETQSNNPASGSSNPDGESTATEKIPPSEKVQTSVYDLRLAILGLLTNLCSTHRGGQLLASHRTITGRVIRLLHESLVTMYDCNPRLHELVTACVNHSVMLLGHLCFSHGDTLDLRSKLAAEPGGHHKHLVSLSRVAFMDGESQIEDGIWSESAEAAHRMLDEFLSPEEGEAVVHVFSSGRSVVG